MKATCTQENFKKAISITEKVIGKQSTLPILENILIETLGGMLKISATNLEVGVFVKIGAKIEREGSLTVPARLVGNFINNLPAKNNIDLEINDQTLVITSGKYKANIMGLVANDFPIIPEMKEGFLFSLSAQETKEILQKIIPSVSLDINRPEISGVNMILSEKEATFAATDGYRLGEVVMGVEKTDKYLDFIHKSNSFIIPINTVLEILRSIEGEIQKIKVFIEENQIFFQIGNVRIVSRLINGKYPEYKQIIPQKFETHIIIDKDELLKAVRIASFFTNNKTGEINLKVNSTKKNVIIGAFSEDKGGNESELNIEIEGVDQEFIFNPRYVLDGINAIMTNKVAVFTNTNQSPVVLREIEDGGVIREGFTYVIMPIRK